jgi:hypothetical protein
MIYWISTDYVLNNLPVEYSLLSGNIMPALQQAHFINARDLVGDLLYDQINLMITTGTIDDVGNEDYKFLLDTYLTDVVLYWTQVYMTTNLLAKYANRGLSTETSEFSTNADLSLYRTLKNEFIELAGYYSQRCRDWLYFNQNLYPEYQYFIQNGLQPANPRDKYKSGGLILDARPRFSWNNMCWY